MADFLFVSSVGADFSEDISLSAGLMHGSISEYYINVPEIYWIRRVASLSRGASVDQAVGCWLVLRP